MGTALGGHGMQRVEEPVVARPRVNDGLVRQAEIAVNEAKNRLSIKTYGGHRHWGPDGDPHQR